MRILIPLDRTAAEHEIAALCGEVAAMPEATFVLLHVLPLPESIDPANAAEASAFLAEAARAITASDTEVLCVLRHGDPVDEIVAVGRQMDADLIVMHVGGRRHVSNSVLEAAGRPVITIDDHESGTGHGLYAGLALRAGTRRARHLSGVAQAA